MHDKDAERMLNFMDVSNSDIKKIKAEVSILIGDRYIVKTFHALSLSRTIPHGRLMILPVGHGDCIGEIVMTKKVVDIQKRLLA